MYNVDGRHGNLVCFCANYGVYAYVLRPLSYCFLASHDKSQGPSSQYGLCFHRPSAPASLPWLLKRKLKEFLCPLISIYLFVFSFRWRVVGKAYGWILWKILCRLIPETGWVPGYKDFSSPPWYHSCPHVFALSHTIYPCAILYSGILKFKFIYQENKGVEDLGDVIREGGGALAEGLFRGVTGILTNPPEEAKN